MQHKSIVIIGAGNVATALGRALADVEHSIIEIVSKNLDRALMLAEKVNSPHYSDCIEQINTEADMYIIAVSDDAIAEVVQRMPEVKGVVTHTSGVVGGEELMQKFTSWGIFYPLQTFTATRIINFKDIPFLLTAGNTPTEDFLKDVAKSIGSKPYLMNEEEKAHVHVAAVLTNNFVNHLLTLADEYIDQHHIPANLFHPLLKETVAKAIDIGAKRSQTGPAKRGDHGTIDKHLELLESTNNETLLLLYKTFTKSIREHY